MASSVRTAEQTYQEFSSLYTENVSRWKNECIEIGRFKEELNLYRDSLTKRPLFIAELTSEILVQTHKEFEEVGKRLNEFGNEISKALPKVSAGIIDIRKSIDQQAKQDLSGLDKEIQEKATQLAESAKQYLKSLLKIEEHMTVLLNHANTRLKVLNSDWVYYESEYTKRFNILNPPPPKPSLFSKLIWGDPAAAAPAPAVAPAEQGTQT